MVRFPDDFLEEMTSEEGVKNRISTANDGRERHPRRQEQNGQEQCMLRYANDLYELMGDNTGGRKGWEHGRLWELQRNKPGKIG